MGKLAPVRREQNTENYRSVKNAKTEARTLANNACYFAGFNDRQIVIQGPWSTAFFAFYVNNFSTCSQNVNNFSGSFRYRVAHVRTRAHAHAHTPARACVGGRQQGLSFAQIITKFLKYENIAPIFLYTYVV